MSKKKTIEQFAADLHKIHGDKIKLAVDAEYVAAREPINVECQVCSHTWAPLAYNLLSGYGCPSCRSQKARDSAGTLRCPRGSEAEKAKARELRAEGLTYRAIGAQLGRTDTAVMSWCDPTQAKKVRQRAVAHHKANREHKKAVDRHYKNETPHGRASSRASWARRRGIKQEWYTNCPLDMSREQAVYLECERINRETGIEHHVDHIWPLSQGGPHLWFNLQLLTAEENLSKGGKFRDCDKELYAQRISDLFNAH